MTTANNPVVTAERLAEQFHEAYERLAPSFSYKTRDASAVPWADVPDANKRLMIAVCAELLPTMTQASPPPDEMMERVAWAINSAFNELSIGMPLTQDEAFALARAALQTIGPMRGWEPIETAPKDVPIVLGYFGDVKELHGAATVGRFFQWKNMDKALASGWAWRADPTHWMPLPNPPKSIGIEDQG